MLSLNARWLRCIPFTLLLAGVCGCAGNAPQLAGSPARGLSLLDALAQVETVPLPGLDAVSAAQLRASFGDALLVTGKTRFTSAAPSSGPLDLTVTDNGDGTATFAWTYRNPGDLDQNSEVNVADLSALGANLGKTPASPDWPRAQVADGDGNGEVNISDISTLGANLLNLIEGYRLEISADSGANWDPVEEILFAMSQVPDGGGYRVFNHPVDSPQTGHWYRVVGYGAGADGAPSNIVLYLAGSSPQIQNVTATQGTLAGQVDLTWDSNPDAGFGYGIYRADSAGGPYTLLDSTLTNQYSDTTALPGAHYWYKVEGYTLSGPFGLSDPAEGWAASQITGVAATQGTLNLAVTITWDAHPDATSGYGVFRADIPDGPWLSMGTPMTNQFTDSIAQPGVHHWYGVEGYNVFGGIGRSVPAEGWAMEAAGPPAAPQNVDASTSLSDRVTVTWSAVAGADTYHIWRSPTAGSGHSEIGAQPGGTTTYDDLTASPNANYYYYVTAENAQGISPASFEDVGFWVSLVPPPANLAATDGTLYTSVSLSWDAVTDATGYRVWRSETSGSGHAEIGFVGAPTLAYDDFSAALGVTYYYHVTAQTPGGPSPASNEDSGWKNHINPPQLSLDSPPPVGDGTQLNPYVVPDESDWLFTMLDGAGTNVTSSPHSSFETSDANVTISGRTLLVGATPPPSFTLHGKYGYDSNYIYFVVP